MGKRTVRQRIFISNTVMVLATLAIFLLVNMAVIKIYAESVEHELRASAEMVVDEEELKDLLEDWTIKRNEFILLFALDGMLCIVVLLGVSLLFTRNLADYILHPLHELTDGAQRVQQDDLTRAIDYEGALEFERVCGAFNEMQEHILEEREKNRRYEKARTDMAAGISHDLRTPLTAIRGAVKALLDGVASSPEQQKIFLQTAYRRTGDMDVLLNQLFYLSRLETGNMPLELETLNLTEYIRDYVKENQEQHGTAEFRMDLPESSVFAAIDSGQMKRVLDNLLENSMKYAETEPLKIDLRLWAEKGWIWFCFSDNGCGVPDEKLSHLFEEFYRVDESRNRKEGNGLGLYIVKYLIEAMGGTAWAENDSGLSVFLKLPEARVREAQEGEREKDGEQKTDSDRGG